MATKSVKTVPKPKAIRKDIQEKVDIYIKKYEEMKALEAELKLARPEIEVYMNSKGIDEIKGTKKGKIYLSLQERPEVTARFTSYSVTQVEPLLSSSAKKKCIVKAVDRDLLEALVKLDEAPKKVLDLKMKYPTEVFLVNPK